MPTLCPIYFKSVVSLKPTLNIINNVSSSTGILILHGQNDSGSPVQQAFLLQQTLTDKRHPDHTLITYPNLGHFFYPSSEWQTQIWAHTKYVWQIFILGLKLILDLQTILRQACHIYTLSNSTAK